VDLGHLGDSHGSLTGKINDRYTSRWLTGKRNVHFLQNVTQSVHTFRRIMRLVLHPKEFVLGATFLLHTTVML
jgi:hypothetical protein